jgi:hypothetical protein
MLDRTERRVMMRRLGMRVMQRRFERHLILKLRLRLSTERMMMRESMRVRSHLVKRERLMDPEFHSLVPLTHKPLMLRKLLLMLTGVPVQVHCLLAHR